VAGDSLYFDAPDGLRLHAATYGPKDAPLTALCMHGLTRNHKDFEPMIAALPDRYRFISVDVRGRALSDRDPNPENYTPAAYVGDMTALLDRLGLRRVALIGTSMGGLMSMIMAKAIPDRISGIVMNDVGPVLDKAGLDRIAAYAGKTEPFESWQAAANAVARVQGDIFPDYGPDDWMAFARRTCREGDDGLIHLDYDPAITRTVSDVRPGFFTRRAMWKLFRAMRSKPLLVIRGETSDILSQKTAGKMTRIHPDARRVTVPRVGHAPILDEPEAVSAISTFLARLEGLQ